MEELLEENKRLQEDIARLTSEVIKHREIERKIMEVLGEKKSKEPEKPKVSWFVQPFNTVMFAEHLGITKEAARQILQVLNIEGALKVMEPQKYGARGRPTQLFKLRYPSIRGGGETPIEE